MKRIALFAIAIALIAATAVAWRATTPSAMPGYAAVRDAYTPSEAYLLDRHGEVIQVQREDFAARRLPWVTLGEISPALEAAVLQAEDRRFREHAGVDLRAFAAAARHAADRGASTITMQLASLLDPSLAPKHGRRTLLQKARQVRAAWALESSWSKDQILEAYLNLVSFRGELAGVRTATHALLGKAPSGLTRDESFVLAALLPAPGADTSRVAARACTLRRALEPDAACAPLQALAVAMLDGPRPIEPEANLAPHLARRLLNRAGERRRSTLDASIQKLAIDTLTQQVMGLADRNVRDAAAVVVDNVSGDVLAYVGSVDLDSRAPLVDGARATRQAGSTLKPFLYALAIQKRYMTAATLLDDAPVRLQTGSGLYVPQDYDRDFRGLVSVRSALAGSLNVPAVRTLVLVGGDPFLDLLHALGYDSMTEPAEHYGYSLALGSADVSLLEQVNAFRTLANAGEWSALRFADADPPPSPRRVLPADAAYIVGDILSDRGGRAVTFGLGNVLGTPFWSAVKTGTSKFMRDNWCIGYSTRYTVGVWVGNFDGEPMRDVSGVAGAAPAWLEIMMRLHEGVAVPPPSRPDSVRAIGVTFADGLEPPRRELFLDGTELATISPAPAQSLKPRLQSPPGGTVIALDPDIPADRQQVLFRSEPRDGRLRYELDGAMLASASGEFFWSPEPGAHRLRLVDRSGASLDEVTFSVRRP